jgi:CheY-like chemotaxis protein
VSTDVRLGRFLQRHLRGYSVITAPDLPQAIELARETHAAGILVDAHAEGRDVDQGAPVPILRVPLRQGERLAPVLQATAYLDKPVTQAELADAVAAIGRPVRSALVVDDDPSFAELMARMLTASTHQDQINVIGVRNGREALVVLRDVHPDLVILDMVMPELSGRETLAAIRSDPRFADLPVFIVSAQSQLEANLRVSGSISVYSRDGFRLDELLGAVEALLGRLSRLNSAA